TAEAGLGKSRLVAEVIRSARKMGFTGYGGACQLDAINTPYHAWKPIWAAFFLADPELPLRKQIRWLEGEIEDHAPERLQAMPLLNILLNLDIPDNDFTRNLTPQYRQSALYALLEDCLRATAHDEPLLIVIENFHWVDALSYDLLKELARALPDSPVCIVLAYRPAQLAQVVAESLELLPNFTKIELCELDQFESEQAVRAKLAQLYPERSSTVLPALMKKLMARAQGNPFYLEELLNFLHDRGLDPLDLDDLEQTELPDSLHSLILSRIDQLTESQKMTLSVASIIGRFFRVAWLTGYYPDLGTRPYVQANLEKLAEIDITLLDISDPELAYLFKHIVTHEVTYETLPFATRARLHEQLAHYLERQIAAGTLRETSVLDALVYHYSRSDNEDKQRVYLRKAGQAALAVSAFNTAVDYFTRLLELTPEADSAWTVLALQLAEAHYRSSNYPAARAAIEQAQAAAKTDADRAAALALLGEMLSQLGEYAEAQAILAEAVLLARVSGEQLTLCRALYALGATDCALGKVDSAHISLNESLKLARELGDLNRELFALNRLATMCIRDDLVEAEQLLHEVHRRAVAAGNRERATAALNNLGVVADEGQDFVMAREYFQQALALAREIGAQQMVALYLSNLAYVNIKLGELDAAREDLRAGLALALRLGVLPRLVNAVMYFADLFQAEGQSERSLALLGLARCHPAWNNAHERELEAALVRWSLDPAVVETGLAKGAELDWHTTIQELLKG
ncbi:MAG: ATP-binding protein, partial [Anaerolineae bacterium]